MEDSAVNGFHIIIIMKRIARPRLQLCSKPKTKALGNIGKVENGFSMIQLLQMKHKLSRSINSSLILKKIKFLSLNQL